MINSGPGEEQVNTTGHFPGEKVLSATCSFSIAGSSDLKTAVTKIATLEWGEIQGTKPGILPEEITARAGSCLPGQSPPRRNRLIL